MVFLSVQSFTKINRATCAKAGCNFFMAFSMLKEQLTLYNA